ncbi:peptidoglycan-binding domain-containing protein [Roseovarius indicus]|uniref:Spore cortex-lytic enzyme n=1 Tax=Roseovarius indicus TaxID=540747 RepID=A0A5P3AK36_9RHOB|nr:peptidoglycan-binding domain-containing protein [Roseovarius indicus]QEW29083.1 spore cortex-lytic enzyme [Roseovarius indicus]SFD80096.1 Putative peptidoglycan binding domain-containing protein [Roseovarius indicus]
MFRLCSGLVTALCLIAPAALAEDLALVIGDRGQAIAYQEEDGADAGAFRDALTQAGFRVVEPPDRDIRSMRLAAVNVETALTEGRVDRLVIVATGPFATDGSDSWVLSNNAQGVKRVMVGAMGISLNALTAIATQQDIPVVMMVSPGRMPKGLAAGLQPGPRAYRMSEDVTYITGPSPALADMLAGSVLLEGVSFAELAQNAPDGVKVEGDLSRTAGLMGSAAMPPSDEAVETGFWQAVQTFDTISAYRMYLGEYPEGTHAGEARERIAYLQDEPEREAKSTEEGLGLSRNDRREIQRNLALIGFDPKGIDGIFGPGSRAAISDWQQENGFGVTGYLTGNQLLRLRDQAQAEAKRQEEEARRRQEEEERKDRAYWQETGEAGGEDGLRAYLDRYPDGLYADEAQEALDQIEAAKREDAEREEREAWDAARSSDTAESYSAFLNTYPDSTFAGAARARLNELTDQRENAAEIEAARAQERQFTSTLIARVLIERRLASLGTNPGAADGDFTRQTRRAIRQFQRSRNLPVTGFISQATMVQLMAGR